MAYPEGDLAAAGFLHDRGGRFYRVVNGDKVVYPVDVDDSEVVLDNVKLARTRSNRRGWRPPFTSGRWLPDLNVRRLITDLTEEEMSRVEAQLEAELAEVRERSSSKDNKAQPI